MGVAQVSWTQGHSKHATSAKERYGGWNRIFSLNAVTEAEGTICATSVIA